MWCLCRCLLRVLEVMEVLDGKFDSPLKSRLGDDGRDDAREMTGVDEVVVMREKAGVPGCLSS